MEVSIIVAMYNIGKTLTETLESIAGQTHMAWETVLVDDGSTDDTAQIAQGFVERDARFGLIQRPNGGVSAARNTGIEHARHDWLLFLDGDDWLLPQHLERMTAELQANPTLDGVYCGWCWYSPDGYYFHRDIGRHTGDLFHVHADECPYSIHAYIVRRSIVQAVGGFDPKLRTCEDWDVWQRISRTGMRFGRVAEVMAPARMRASSASMDGRQILRDGLKVLEQGHAPDPRVAEPHPIFPYGLLTSDLPKKKYYLLCSAAGLLIGRGKDPCSLLDMIDDSDGSQLDYHAVAECVTLAALLSASRPLGQWDRVWLDLEPLTSTFLDALEEQTGTPDLAARSGKLTRHLVRLYMGDMGGIHRVRGWLSRGALLPDKVSASAKIFLWYVKRVVGSGLKLTPRLHRKALRLQRHLSPVEDGDYFEELFEDQADPWRYSSAYEQTKYEQTLSLLPTGQIDKALELACAEGHFTVQLAPRVRELLSTDISSKALERAAERCREHSNITFQVLNITRQTIPSPFDLIVCSEVLYYAGTYAKLRKLAGKIAAALKPGGYLVMAHGNVVIDEPDRPGFNWEHHFGAKGIGETFANVPALEFVKEIQTNLYRIQLFRRTATANAKNRTEGPEIIQTEHARELEPEVAAQVLWQGTTQRLPILLYHSVAPTGSEASADYRVTPEAFEQQLEYLRDHGYRSARPEDCYNWFYEFSHLPCGSVLISFDDGYRDFLEHAWPLLQRYGFSAHVFLVAGLVGKTNAWDEHLMETKPLMDWDEIRQLQGEGVTFGSHSLTHPTLTSTSLSMVRKELVQSRVIIEHELGERISTLAYPYGEFNRRILYLAGLCEYDLAVTCESDICTLTSSPLAMPRIEIEGQDSLDVFAQKVSEPSEA